MDGWYTVKNFIVNFKLDLCCWVAPVKVELFLSGYFNIIFALVSLMGIADESFKPVLVQVQETLLPDNSKKPIPILAYSTELAFNSILICALHQMDITLMRVYMRYNMATLVGSILVYSLVLPVIGIMVAFTMVLSIFFQLYVLILVRSMIVEIRLDKKRHELPKLVMTTTIDPENTEKSFRKIENVPVLEDIKVEVDTEVPEVKEEIVEEEKKQDAKLETVVEHPKEEKND